MKSVKLKQGYWWKSVVKLFFPKFLEHFVEQFLLFFEISYILQEECFDKVCTEINPAKPPPPPPADFWLSRPRELQTEEAKLGPHSRPTSAFDFQNRTFAAFAPSVGQAKTVITAGRDAYVSDYMERYSDPEWAGVDSEGRFIRAESPQQYWFCSGTCFKSCPKNLSAH